LKNPLNVYFYFVKLESFNIFSVSASTVEVNLAV